MIAVAAVTVLGTLVAGARHGALMIDVAERQAKARAEQEDESKSNQLQVELFAEGMMVRAAAKIQAELRAGRSVAPGVVLERESLLAHGLERIRGRVEVLAVEGDSYTLQSDATCEVSTPWRRETYGKQATLSVEITAQGVGDLSNR